MEPRLSQAHALPPEIEAVVTKKAGSLNMLPSVAAQAIEIAKDPDCSMGEFSAVVERDAKLATDILSMANSVIYSPGRPILALNQAVVRLGFQQCRNLIYSSSMVSLMGKISLEEEWIRESLCRHGFVTALLSMRINQALKVGCQGEEFTVGLMHDFGRTLMAICFPDKFRQADSMNFDEISSDFLKSERNVAGADHCQLGAWFAQNNGLPGALVEAIRLHHLPERAVLNTRLTALTAVSDHIANHIQRGDAASTYDPSTNAGIAALEAAGVVNAASRLSQVVVPLMEQVATDADELMNF